MHVQSADVPVVSRLGQVNLFNKRLIPAHFPSALHGFPVPQAEGRVLRGGIDNSMMHVPRWVETLYRGYVVGASQRLPVTLR